MKKKLLVLIAILLTIVTLPTIKPAQAASVPQITWLPPYFSLSSDDVAYEDGQTVKLAVQVLSSEALGFNVSKVILNFRYLGVNKTYALPSVEKIANGDAKVYTVSFVADADEFLMGATSHYYRIIVENVNGTGSQLTPLIYASGSPTFKVYTAEYIDAYDLSNEFWNYYYEWYWWDFDNAEAQGLGFDATQQAYKGEYASDRGDYVAAKTYYEAAIDLYKQALAAEQDWQQVWEDADLNTTLTTNAAIMAGANANLTWADADMVRANGEAEAAVIAANGTRLQGEAALMNAYGFYAIGIGFAVGWSLIGIGVIVYAFKRPKPT